MNYAFAVSKVLQAADLGGRMLAATVPVLLPPLVSWEAHTQAAALEAGVEAFQHAPQEEADFGTTPRLLAELSLGLREGEIARWTPARRVDTASANGGMDYVDRRGEASAPWSGNSYQASSFDFSGSARRESGASHPVEAGEPSKASRATAPQPLFPSAKAAPVAQGSALEPDLGSTADDSEAAAPQTFSDLLVTSRNEPITFFASTDLLGNDVAGGPLSLVSVDTNSVAMPAGTITPVTSDQFTYSPGAGFVGTDSFAYRVSSLGKEAVGTVSVTVSPKTPPAAEEVKSGTATASATVATSSSLTAASGQTYVAFVSHHDDAISVTSVSGLGLTWTLIERQCTTQNNGSIEAWSAAGTSPSSTTVTANLSGPASSAQIAVVRLSGAPIVGAIGATSRANANGGSGACGAGPSSKLPASDIVLSSQDSRILSAVTFFLASNSHSPDQGSEIAELGSGSNPNATWLAVVSNSSPSDGSLPLSSTLAAAGRWATISLEVRAD
ncbi:MAG: hypothetical protein IT285_14910 [Bdellovibrionales bacterium]|nr:hypothetical protein [Bdellovibrionales bacterium]